MPNSASIQQALSLLFTVEVDASSGVTFTVPRAGIVLGVTVTGISGTGTATLSSSTGDITEAVVSAVDTQAAATTISRSYINIAANDTLTVTTDAAPTLCLVAVNFLPTPAPFMTSPG